MKEEVKNNDVVQQYESFYLSLYILGLTMVYTMLQISDIMLMLGLFIVCVSMYYKWLGKNKQAQTLVYKQLKELAAKSEKEYRESKHHLMYSVSTMIEEFDGTIQDLTYVLVDLMDSGIINVFYSTDEKMDKFEHVYALEKSPVKAQFRSIKDKKRVDIKHLKVTFDEKYAELVYEQQVKRENA